MNLTRPRHALNTAVWVLPLFFLFNGLACYGLLDNNEGMYAEIAREMLSGQHWSIPTLDGVPYIEKPPLLYWLTAFSMQLFGSNAFAARLIPVFAAIVTLLLVQRFAWRMLNPLAAALAVLVLGSQMGFVMMSRTVMPDMLMVAGLTGAWLAAFVAIEEQRRRDARRAAVWLALALLSKGFVAGVLFGLVVLPYIATLPKAARQKAWPLLRGPVAWGLFLLIIVPWHVAASLSLHEFAWFYFINEHVYRFLGIRTPQDYYHGSVLYYLPRLAAFALPWTPFLLLARPATDDPARRRRRFLWLALLVPLVFFSLSSAKANYYELVCLPPFALLVAEALAARLARPSTGRGLNLASGSLVALVLVLVAAWAWVLRFGQLPASVPLNSPAFVRALLALLLLALLAFAAFKERRPGWGIAFTAALFLPVQAGMLDWLQRHEALVSARPLLQSNPALATEPLMLYADYEWISSVPFYAGRALPVIDSQSSDLDFARTVGRWPNTFLNSAAIPPALHGWIVTRPGRLSRLLKSSLGPRLRIIGIRGSRVLLELLPANPASPAGAAGNYVAAAAGR